MSIHEDAKDAVKRARELTAQHEKLFADHGLPVDVCDQVLKRDDLGDEVRSKIEQEKTSRREKARSDAFASAREKRQGHKHKPHSGMI